MINILLCNCLNSFNSSTVNRESSVMILDSSAAGTNRFKLKNIVGNDI